MELLLKSNLVLPENYTCDDFYMFLKVPVFNYNKVWADEDRLLRIRPELGEERSDGFFGIQEAFFDYHIRNVSTRYDFDSVRIGIQPFISDCTMGTC